MHDVSVVEVGALDGLSGVPEQEALAEGGEGDEGRARDARVAEALAEGDVREARGPQGVRRLGSTRVLRCAFSTLESFEPDHTGIKKQRIHPTRDLEER